MNGMLTRYKYFYFISISTSSFLFCLLFFLKKCGNNQKSVVLDDYRIESAHENEIWSVQMKKKKKTIPNDITDLSIIDISQHLMKKPLFLPLTIFNFTKKHRLELCGDDLVRALRSSQNAADITMKLTKKDGFPTLSLVIETQVKIREKRGSLDLWRLQ